MDPSQSIGGTCHVAPTARTLASRCSGRSTVFASMSRLWWLLPVVSSLWLACATTASASTPTAPPPRSAPAPALPEAELSEAWAPEVSSPRPTSPTRAPPPRDRRAAHRDAMADAQRALQARHLEDAQAAIERACAEAADLGGQERAHAWALAFAIASARGEASAAVDVALAWRRACGPERTEACRADALRALGEVAAWKGAEARAVTALARALKDADACATQAERGARALPCLAAADELAARHSDALLAAQVAVARALAERSAPRQAALLTEAERRCEAATCAPLRRRALARLAAVLPGAREPEGAVRLALRENAVAASLVEPELRAWVRSPELDALCARYDAAAGAGACRRLERELNGGWTFRDFSRGKPTEALTAEQVKVVNEHYAPLLQECLGEQARRLTPPDAQRFDVSWTVQNDGTVREAHLRRDLDDSPLAQCLRAQFPRWRYPRFTGELQHVQQSFVVTAVERVVR
jgi:hypothetical protein